MSLIAWLEKRWIKSKNFRCRKAAKVKKENVDQLRFFNVFLFVLDE